MLTKTQKLHLTLLRNLQYELSLAIASKNAKREAELREAIESQKQIMEELELDKDYYEAACARLKAHQAQQTLFAPEYQVPTQASMLE